MVTEAPLLNAGQTAAPALPEPARTEAVEAMTSQRFRIAGDVVARATEELPDEQKTAVRWFAGYCRKRNLGPEECATLLPRKPGSPECYSWDSIYALITGRRRDQGVSIEPICKAIEAFRRQVESVSRAGESGFIQTRLSKAIWQRMDRARERAKISFIFGESQIGKSEALMAYERARNDCMTVYIETPGGACLSGFQERLSHILAVPQVHRHGDRGDRLISCFSKGMLLIVDEAHRLLKKKKAFAVFDWLRELYNRSNCGIVLAMTPEGRGYFDGKGSLMELHQLWNRRIAPLVLPKTLPSDDLALFAAYYGLDPAPDQEVRVKSTYIDEHGREREGEFKRKPLELQTEVVSREGLGVWITILQDAADMARDQRRAISWAAVLRAYCLSQADSEVWG